MKIRTAILAATLLGTLMAVAAPADASLFHRHHHHHHRHHHHR